MKIRKRVRDAVNGHTGGPQGVLDRDETVFGDIDIVALFVHLADGDKGVFVFPGVAGEEFADGVAYRFQLLKQGAVLFHQRVQFRIVARF